MIKFLKKYFESQCNKESNENATDDQKKLGINLIPAKNIKCRCKREEDVNIVEAVEIDGDIAFKKYLNKEKFEFKSYHHFYGCDVYEIKNTYIDIVVDMELGFFKKSACLACNTCLGWSHITFNSGEKTKVSESPEEYFSRIMREHFSFIKDHVADEKKRISEKELALKICGESDEIV